MKTLTLIIAVGVPHVAFGYEYTVQILPLRPDAFGIRRASYRDMNNHGDVVGRVDISGNLVVSFLYRNGNFSRLEVIPNSGTLANYINDLGQVAGHTNSSPYNTDFLYENGTYTQLFSPINGAGMSIEALEDNGDFAGLVSTPLPTGHEPYAMIDGTFYLVPMPARTQYGILTGLNARGQGIGDYLRRENTDFSTFSWTREGGIVERPYGSGLIDINDLDEIVGRDRDDNGFLERNGSIIPLPGIPKFINNRSEIITIVNRRSMIWQNGVTRLIDDLLEPPYQTTAVTVIALNDRGVMLARLDYGGGAYDSAILRPVPEPSTLASFGTFVLLGYMRRRRRSR